MSLSLETESILLPNFSEQEIGILKKYFEYNKRYNDIINQKLMAELLGHPLWGPMMKQMTPEQQKAQNERSQELQRAAIYDGKWGDYANDLVMQGKVYARMNVSYTDWYELIRMVKSKLLPHIKEDFHDSAEEAVDFIDGLSKFVDYAMYGIAEAYFQEKNAALRNSEEKLRAIFENSPDQILLLARDGEILAINHSSLKLESSDLVGKSVFNFCNEDNIPYLKKVVEGVFENKKPGSFELKVVTAEGTKYYDGNMSPIMNKTGDVASIVMLSREVTLQKEAEIERNNMNLTLEKKVAERTEELNNINKELESFTYSVSHDLRGPLRAINGFSEILREEGGSHLNGEATDALNEILRNAKKMGQLIDDLLEFSRLGKQHISKARVDMRELFGSVISDFRKSAPLVSFNMISLGEATGDRSMLKQVVVNLVSNAIKYSAKKPNPKIEIGSEHKNDSKIYYVKDNGAGFNMDYYDKLFGVFQRLHRSDEFEGTGVGLAIVQRIIGRHSGKVWAEGKENEGATFYFSIPEETILNQ